MSVPPIAIVGLACRYPDARTPEELWHNALARRRAFRRIPPERLSLDDYLGEGVDSVYVTRAALLESYAFDRVAYRVAGRSFESADLSHWLALDVAADALADAGFDHGDGLPRDETGVVVGNTLTGEFSRAGLLRLRWPYVRRRLADSLRQEGWDDRRLSDFLAAFEVSFKEPFPVPGEESLAGGLANTIAGRIANHFDLHGGGYTVDGACSSSLLAVYQGCTALALGDLKVAVVGGVDLSLDPFELVGFSRTGALAHGEMRVFDREPTGFLPGEGCGFAVLMNYDDAVAEGRRIYAVVRGWGQSSDGAGGLTRPEPAGQTLALDRAYRRAGFGADTVSYFEAHATGTAVGDAAELTALNGLRRRAGARDRAVVGSIKALIGHTKAAAGAAGLIKAISAISHQVLPPTAGCREPHEQLTDKDARLRVTHEPETWPADRPLRASVSAMGFGGINCHVVLEGVTLLRRRGFTAVEQRCAVPPQGVELFVFDEASDDALLATVESCRPWAGRLSVAELTDLAATLATRAAAVERDGAPRSRAAVVASRPDELEERLDALVRRLRDPAETTETAGVFLGRAAEPPRVGFLFPGQGSPSRLDGGAWAGRFAHAAEARASLARLPAVTRGDLDPSETSVAQPAIVTHSLVGLELLRRLGVEAQAALGHSLGELPALCWAGVFDRDTVLRVAEARGAAMSELGDATGTMAALGASASDVEAWIEATHPDSTDAPVIAAINGPENTVVAGPESSVRALVEHARRAGCRATPLAVSHAFHSPWVAAAGERLDRVLAETPTGTIHDEVISTVTGEIVTESTDLRELLVSQVTRPVRFLDAVRRLAEKVDLLVEVGPGRTLSELAKGAVSVPAVSLDVGADDLGSLLGTVAELFVRGAPVRIETLFEDRFSRPFDTERDREFLLNPCEAAPSLGIDSEVLEESARHAATIGPVPTPGPSLAASPAKAEPAAGNDPLAVVRTLVARRTELPAETLEADARFLTDLHMSSISVGEVVTEAALSLGLPPPLAPTEYADASLGELAEALALMGADAGGRDAADEGVPQGLESWVRPFEVVWTERPLRKGTVALPDGPWSCLFGDGDPLGEALARRLGGPSLGDPSRKPVSDETRGLVVVLSADDGPETQTRLLEAAQTTARRRLPLLAVEVETEAGRSSGASGFLRSLHLETLDAAVAVTRVPPSAREHAEDWVERILAELPETGFHESRLDDPGLHESTRQVPVWRLLEESETTTPPLDPGDVLLVIGGGKGIGAECALALAQRLEVKIGILGRSHPDSDDELQRNLERFAAHGVECRYEPADATDPQSLARAVERIAQELGPVVGLVHSAGRNVPKPVTALTLEDIESTAAPKVDGFEHVLAAVDPDRLRLVVAFGSIIGRMGLHGEAHYAAANERLRRRLEAFAEEHPACNTLCLEWSVWEGVGMGARLADLETLHRQGISPIPVEDGVGILLDLVHRPTPSSLVVSGRFGDLPTVELERAELPFWRFLERPRFHVPGVELVVDSELVDVQDPYLDDHQFAGEPLFAAVLGLEAMTQAAAALVGRTDFDTADGPGFEMRRLVFERPVVVPSGEPTVLRLAAVAHGRDRVAVAVRSSRTDFAVDHFRALVDFRPEATEDAVFEAEPGAGDLLPVTPEQLYDRVLFQRGRFQRVTGYRELQATRCRADIAVDPAVRWYGPLLPQTLLLGDPGARDASIHGVQGCIPHHTVLPIAVRKIVFGSPAALRAGGPRRLVAQERSAQGRNLTYDLQVTTEDGAFVEAWLGLELRIVDEPRSPIGLAPPLLGPYLERRLADLLPDSGLRVSVAAETNGRSDRGRHAVEAMLGKGVSLVRRPDGKPEIVTEGGLPEAPLISLAHGDALTLAVLGPGTVGCDVEAVKMRPAETWRGMLGSRHGLLTSLVETFGAERPPEIDGAEPEDALATRLWTLIEGLEKAGTPPDAPVVFQRATDDGWMLFTCGPRVAATVVWSSAGRREPVSIAVVAEPGAPSRGDRP